MSLEPLFSREHFELDPEILWVMHCAEGPVPKATARAVIDFLPRETQPWKLRWKQDFLGLPEETRERAARLLGGRSEDVTLTPTTSTGLVTIAQGFPWEPGDEVLTPLGEFPSNAWPWRALEARGVSWREAAIWEGQSAGRKAWESAPPTAAAEPEERLLAEIGPRTRVLSVSWVRFQDGLALDLPRLAAGCRERGVVLVVDAIQGLGTLPLELEGLGALASGAHKGLLAPQGLGILWTDPGFRRRLVPSGSWLSVEDAARFDRPSTDFDRAWHDDGTRLEAGVPNLLGCAALRESLGVIVEAGVPELHRHVRRLEERFLEGLTGIPAWAGEARRLAELFDNGRLGSILGLHHGGRGPEGLDRILRAGFERGIYASVREGYLRIALHGWHGGGDVDRLLAWLEEVS